MGPHRALDHKDRMSGSLSCMLGFLDPSFVTCAVDAWCEAAAWAVHLANPLVAVDRGENARETLAGMVLGQGSARLGLCLQACLHVHRIPVLKSQVRSRINRMEEME